MKLNYLALIVSISLLSACDDSRLYEKNVDFNDRVWLADSIANFVVDIDSTNQPYNLYLNIRNVNTYPYHNLYVKYVIEDSLNNEIASDLINNNLFHEKTGKPFGSGLGDIFSHQFLFLENHKFDKPGQYNIKLQQFMRKDSLEGIISAGIRVEQVPVND